jgi:hypothetical protein
MCVAAIDRLIAAVVPIAFRSTPRARLQFVKIEE